MDNAGHVTDDIIHHVIKCQHASLQLVHDVENTRNKDSLYINNI